MIRKSNPAVVWTLIAINVYAVVYTLVYMAQSTNEASLRTWTYVCPILVGAFAVVMVWLGRRSSTPDERRTWQWLGIGLGLWFSAEIVRAFLSSSHRDLPYPSLADALWLTGYFPIGAAILIRLRRARSRLTVPKVGLALLAGGVLAAIAFAAILDPMIQGYAIARDVESALDVIYPVLDVLLAIGGVLMMLSSGRNRRWNAWLFIGGAMMVWAFSDVWLGLLSRAGSYGPSWFSAITVDIPYTLAYLIFGIGCLQIVAVTRLSTLKAAPAS